METQICKCCNRELSINNFKLTRWGTHVSVCTECATQKMRDNKIRKQQEKEMEEAREEANKNERQRLLAKFTPRELMERLRDLGYEGKLYYTQVHEIDITNF